MIPTHWKFRHTRLADDGRRYLIWASDGGARSEEIPVGEVLAGSQAETDIVWSQLWTPNTLADEGEKDILDVYFDDQAVRTSWFGRLYNDTPVETDTLATLASEVTGTGYAAVTFTRGTDFTDPALDAGDMMTTGSVKTFTAGGAWTAATYQIMATVASGTAGLLIIYAALAATRTLAINDTLDVSHTIKLA